MRQIEPDSNAQNRLMMGPDGTVHVVSAGKNSPPSAEMEGRSVAGQQDLPSERDAGLHGIRRTPQGTSCFSYSAPMPPADGDAVRRALQDIQRTPDGGVCFRYSVPMPLTDRDPARQVLRGVRRAPGKGSICFTYSACMPMTDRDVARQVLRGVRRAPQTGVCFIY